MYVLVNNVQGNNSYALSLKLRQSIIGIMVHTNKILVKHSVNCVTYNVLEAQTGNPTFCMLQYKTYNIYKYPQYVYGFSTSFTYLLTLIYM